MSANLIDPTLDVADATDDATDRPEQVAVRAWARSRGYPIDETPGVPPVVLETYRRVHGG